MAAETSQIFSTGGVRFGSDNDLDSIREIFREPELEGTFFTGVWLDEILDAFDHDNDLAVIDHSLLDFKRADIEPVVEEFAETVLKEFNLLVDVEVLPQLDQDTINGVEVVGVVAACRGEVGNNCVLVVGAG